MGLQDSDDVLTIENCVNLAAQLQCDQIYRIASTRDGKSVLNNNYALNTLPAPMVMMPRKELMLLLRGLNKKYFIRKI